MTINKIRGNVGYEVIEILSVAFITSVVSTVPCEHDSVILQPLSHSQRLVCCDDVREPSVKG